MYQAPFIETVVEDSRGIDQCNCAMCGRIMIIWEDDLRGPDEIQCGKCRVGLNPEWEY